MMNPPFNNSEEMIKHLLLPHFKYSQGAFVPALEIICENIGTIMEVQANFPGTCMKLLLQVKEPFTKEEYEQGVLSKIRVASRKDPVYQIVETSLRNLRKFLGDDPDFLSKTFHREINYIKQPNRLEIFQEVAYKACCEAIDIAVKEIEMSHQEKAQPNSKRLK